MVTKIIETENCTWMSNGNATSKIQLLQKRFDGFRLEDIELYLKRMGLKIVKLEEE